MVGQCDEDTVMERRTDGLMQKRGYCEWDRDDGERDRGMVIWRKHIS